MPIMEFLHRESLSIIAMTWSRNHICQCQCPPPKRKGRNSNQTSPRPGQNHAHPCQQEVAASSDSESMAVRHLNGKRFDQCKTWLKDPQKRSPLSIFSGATTVTDNPKHWYHFGCPVYVLDENLQQGRQPRGGKWTERARIGLYLGRSPQHSRNVALVLNIKTGYVSPQFHVKIDAKFHSVKSSTRQELTRSDWQQATGFIVASKDTEARQSSRPQPEYTPDIPPGQRTHSLEGVQQEQQQSKITSQQVQSKQSSTTPTVPEGGD